MTDFTATHVIESTGELVQYISTIMAPHDGMPLDHKVKNAKGLVFYIDYWKENLLPI